MRAARASARAFCAPLTLLYSALSLVSSVEARVAAWRPPLDRGGPLVGAFDAETLVGFAIYRPHLAEDMAQLLALYVSRGHRDALREFVRS